MSDNQTKGKRGRPAVLGENATVEILRLSQEQADAIKRASKKARKNKSEWMRAVLFDAAQAA